MSEGTIKLPPYNPKRSCDKCGGKSVTEPAATTTYQSGGVVQYINGWPQKHEQEHLLRTCARCGFQWLESCITGSPDTE